MWNLLPIMCDFEFLDKTFRNLEEGMKNAVVMLSQSERECSPDQMGPMTVDRRCHISYYATLQRTTLATSDGNPATDHHTGRADKEET